MAKLYYKDKSLSNGGQEGKSAFEVWKSTFPESEQDTLTISDFLNDIRGDSVFDVLLLVCCWRGEHKDCPTTVKKY